MTKKPRPFSKVDDWSRAYRWVQHNKKDEVLLVFTVIDRMRLRREELRTALSGGTQ